MELGNRQRAMLWPLAALALAVAAGCHHDTNHSIPVAPTASPTPFGTPSPFPTPSPVPSTGNVTATETVTVNPTGGTFQLTTSGYSGTLAYEANSASQSAGGAFTLTNVPQAVPSPLPSGTPVLYFTLQLSSSIPFDSVINMSTVVLPPSIPLSASTTVTEDLYDQTTGTQIGTTSIGTVSGQTVQFAPVSVGPFNESAEDVYLFVISTSGGVTPTPTPYSGSGSTTPTPAPSSSGGSRSFTRTQSAHPE